jgi:hypothetical protein
MATIIGTVAKTRAKSIMGNEMISKIIRTSFSAE